ncbi:MAG: ADP-ribosylglycohydrolase family protein [Candidatus Aminicenantes bacterium]|nr:ADP-ribosylglycohydrolase family protein [Candidatus Aminicenantes bacterium]
MLGAIIGDIVGSPYESEVIKSTKFPLFTSDSRFTDDTVLTVAVADCILHNRDYAKTFKEYGQLYPEAGYGCMFRNWLRSSDSNPYESYGNGSAMRVSPVAFAFDTIDDVLREAERSAVPTHNHHEGVKGAQAIASAIFLAKTGKGKEEIREYIEGRFGYDLSRTLDEIRPSYHFDETCQGSVPEAIIAFLESSDYEDAIRKAISLGGDADTLACMAGGIAEAYYKKIPVHIVRRARQILDKELLAIVDEFTGRYGIK